MQDFEGYFTLDGSVGLYSKSDNDIYHSVYGALSEAYDKFINPANLENYFNNNNKAEILDICYGIGYNTKCFLNYFFKNISRKNIKKYKTFTGNIDKIDTINILLSKKQYINDNKSSNYMPCNCKIYSNNILGNQPLELNNFSIKKNIGEQVSENKNKNKNKNSNDNKYSVFIKAIDINSTLMKLSPFIKSSFKLPKYNSYKTGIEKVDLLLSKSKEIKIEKTYKLLKEVNIILIMKLIDKFKEDFFSSDVIKILKQKSTTKFFDKNLVKFAKFYLKKRYNLSSNDYNLHFLHNIYYQYISKSYKSALRLLENNNINIEFVCDDARNACNDSSERYSFIFLDAFSPAKAPALWSEEFFKLLYEHIHYNGLLLTYSKSASIRNAMLKSNFEIGKIYNKRERKFTGTVASKNHNLIRYKLDNYDLGLINTLAGVTYKDKNLKLSNSEIIYNRNLELENSSLQSSSSFIKKYKGAKNAI